MIDVTAPRVAIGVKWEGDASVEFPVAFRVGGMGDSAVDFFLSCTDPNPSLTETLDANCGFPETYPPRYHH